MPHCPCPIPPHDISADPGSQHLSFLSCYSAATARLAELCSAETQRKRGASHGMIGQWVRGLHRLEIPGWGVSFNAAENPCLQLRTRSSAMMRKIAGKRRQTSREEKALENQGTAQAGSGKAWDTQQVCMRCSQASPYRLVFLFHLRLLGAHPFHDTR